MSALVAPGTNELLKFQPTFSTQVISFNLRCQCRHKHGPLAAISFGTMNSKIEFTFAELNALNKLLGQIKTETHLTADELDFFSLSPHIISSFEKIHKEFMNHIRGQIESGQLKMSGPQRSFNSENDFLLTDKDYTGDHETRIRNLGQRNKDYIKQLDKTKREEYCDLVFAPFKPTDEQRKKLIEILESIAGE